MYLEPKLASEYVLLRQTNFKKKFQYYKGWPKSLQADYDAILKHDPTKSIFLHNLLCGPHTSSNGVLTLKFQFLRMFCLALKKRMMSSSDWFHSIFFHVGQDIIV